MSVAVMERDMGSSSMALRPSFAGLLRAELRKLRQQRGNWILLVALAVFFLPFVPVSLGSLGLQHDPDSFLRWAALSFDEMCNTAVGIFLLLAGARLTGMEYSGGTIRVILARGAGRLQLLAVKLTALLIVGLSLVASFTVFTGAAVYVIHAVWRAGSPSPAAWGAAGGAVAAAAISVVACVLLAAGAGMVGRSTAFAVGAAMGFFPADNMTGTLLDYLASLTHRNVLHQVTGYLLGPNLNTLPGQLAGVGGIILGRPLGVALGHTLAVIGCWCVGLLALAIVAVRRDVSG